MEHWALQRIHKLALRWKNLNGATTAWTTIEFITFSWACAHLKTQTAIAQIRAKHTARNIMLRLASLLLLAFKILKQTPCIAFTGCMTGTNKTFHLREHFFTWKVLHSCLTISLEKEGYECVHNWAVQKKATMSKRASYVNSALSLVAREKKKEIGIHPTIARSCKGN